MTAPDILADEVGLRGGATGTFDGKDQVFRFFGVCDGLIDQGRVALKIDRPSPRGNNAGKPDHRHPRCLFPNTGDPTTHQIQKFFWFFFYKKRTASFSH
jgi:hypothetical protein